MTANVRSIFGRLQNFQNTAVSNRPTGFFDSVIELSRDCEIVLYYLAPLRVSGGMPQLSQTSDDIKWKA
jgi:hypothetical protein